ncbi:MAG: DMT family transporter [Thermoplasmatota archaeon]|jgi:drug/metabolite transporter (DMT)-like permease
MNKPYVALFVSIFSVSFAAILIVSLEKGFGTPPLSIAFFRLLFTWFLIMPFVLLRKKSRCEIVDLSRRDVVFMCVIGLILSAHFAFWVTSLTSTSVASSVLLVTAHPIIVAPLAFYLLKEKLSSVNIFGISMSVSGVILLVYGNYGFSSADTFEGNILAMLGGVAAGLYILGGRLMRKKISVVTYAFIVYGVGTIGLFFFCLFFEQPVYGLLLEEYGIILLLAFVAGILGHTLYNWALKFIPASVASVSLLGEPIGSSILALLLPWIGQVPSWFTVIGGGVILFGIYLTTKSKNGKTVTGSHT